MISFIIFYAGINFGFHTSSKSQVNKAIWIDACFNTTSADFINQLYNIPLNQNYELPLLQKSESILLRGEDYFVDNSNPSSPPIYDFSFPSDSGEEGELLDSTIISGDTTSLAQDSLLTLTDSIKVDQSKIDSTNRLKYFKYTREDKPYVEIDEKKQSKFFVQPSPNLKRRTVEVDSTGKYVIIREKIGNQEVKIPQRIPIDDYIYLKLALQERENWETLGYEYELKSGKIGLGELITSFTDFEIPLPSVGVLSIFGEPKISLKIGGAVQIHGAWRSETTEGVTASRLGNTRNEPDFKQTVQINVNGTIGDKLNISADWNTERTFEYENQLKIKYTGYEDEIIQSIEAGNVSMQTSSLIGGAEALFGIKALFKLGPFSLTTIASQKKGETKEVSVSSGSTSSEYEVRPYDYSENHYFVDQVFADNDIFSGFYFNIPAQVNPDLQINEIEVWKSINVISSDRSKERFANCFIDLPPLPPNGYDTSYTTDLTPVPGISETGRFLLLTQDVDYTLHPETGFISFKTSINEQDIIAVSYKQGTNDITYGEFIATTTDTFIVLKLVKPKNLQPDFQTAWKLRLKNIYPTGSRNVKKEGFEFTINYELVGQEPTDELPTSSGSTRLLEAFGLDQQGAGGNPNPDNVFDWRPGFTIFPETGEIVFPNLQPFGENIIPDFDSLKYQSIYDTTKTFARQDKGPDKWAMVGKNTGDVTSVYQLGFNVVENSVKVILNGRELSPNVDYIVDYNIGQLTIRNDAALVPGADLRITYEQNDLFQLASKTLLGARGLYEFSKKTQLGFTVMNLSQQTLSDKVRIGEEPLSNTIYGADFKTAADLPFVTNLLDNVISTKEMSVFTFNGEYAYMSPDPNTKKSTIPEDDGKSIAYIDDFEGAKRTIPLGIGYGGWKDLSPPERLPLTPNLSKQERMPFKAKSFWFNVTPSDVVVDSIFGGNRQVARADQQITVLDYVFIPDTPGTNNTDPDVLLNPVQNWGGTQRLLSSTANNLVEQNIEFFEFWLNIPEAPPNASMYLDLGLISEDVIPNNRLDQEDKNFNDAIDEGEDTGIDGFFDDEERFQYNSTRGDPSNDNFVFQGQPINIFDYFNINGTQGNAVLTDIGLLPDSEDLNRNGNVDLINSFFRYEIPLDTVAANNPFIAGGGFTSAGWYLIRVPLKDTVAKIGSPSFSNVEAVRLFVQGVTEPIHIRITEFNLVGNQWQKLLPEDSVLSVSVVSLEENTDYTSPPGVFRERDRTRPDEEIFSNEQSLNLVLTDLPDGESRDAVKYLYRPLDVFNYTEMKLFIHGDQDYTSPTSVSYVDPTTGQYSSEVYFRFGTDTSNYYEYLQPAIYNQDPTSDGWTSISINFADLTSIKAAGVDSTGSIKIPVEGQPGHFYQVRGNPTLTSVKYLTVGIYNRNDGFNPGSLSGEVWVNELRVVGADDSPGWAYSFSTSMKFADLMTVNFNMSEKNPYFHKLSERFGSRVESRNWAVQTDLDVLKLIPFNMKESNLRLNFSHTESIGKPLYIPGTDIRVDEAVEQLENAPPDTTTGSTPQSPEQLRLETETLNISNSISASNIKLKIPTNIWYIRDSWNALTFGFNYNNTYKRTPAIAEGTTWVWNGNVNYGINFSPDLYIKPADIPVIGFLFQIFTDYKDVKLYFTPQTFAGTVSARRNRNSSITRPRGTIPTNEIIAQDFTASRGFNFGWRMTEGGLINLSTNYNLGVSSSLAYLLEDQNGNERSESDIWNDILGGAYFGKDYQYQQSIDFRTSPRLPSLWDINRYFTLNAGYSSGYRWDFDLRQEEIGRSAGYNRKFTAGMVLRWKSLTEPLFISEDDKNQTSGNNQRGGGNKTEGTEKNVQTDSTESVVVETPKTSSLTRALGFLKIAVKAVFFDWENFSSNFTHDQSVSKSGIKATGTGFANFWGLTQNSDNGPGRAFQLGFSDDVGPRAFSETTNLSDVFSERNTLDFKTARPLWEGAKLDINWNVGWSETKNTTLRSDALGNIVITNVTSTGTLNRTFLSLPSGFLPFVESGIKKVNTLYNPNAPDPRQSLSNAFVEGFETLPLLSTLPLFSDIAEYVPRPNWRISWDGVEKLLFFKTLADRISLDHSYASTYTEGWKLTREGNRELQSQRIEYGFSPLIGLNITFGELWGGNLTGNIKFSSRTSYDLGLTTTNISETFTQDVGFTAGFSKSGFEMPLFGLSLKNDIEFLFSYTTSANSTIRYEMDNFTEEGIPQDGTTRTTIEPRIKYTISSKVTLAIFYKRSTVEPKGAARIPPTTTNEAGLDVNIVIQ